MDGDLAHGVAAILAGNELCKAGGIISINIVLITVIVSSFDVGHLELSSINWLLLVREEEQDWVDQEHGWDTNGSKDEHRDHNFLLVWHDISDDWASWAWFRVLSSLDEHDDHGSDDTWSSLSGFLLMGSPIGGPLDNDHVVHESEQGEEKEDLGDDIE